ncbi:MAG: hypothetical protein EOP46_02580 [Sphingobacteriaceae bacterium]|nr:MAG: hypothetical protein EOP46_02580 [Sphingobacteriaceae bacterium]
MAKTNARKYLQNYLTNFSTYKPIAFGELDSIVESHLNDTQYIRLDDSIMEIEALRFRDMGENFPLFKYRDTSGWYVDKQSFFKKQRDSIAQTITPRFAGYKLEHEFLATDTNGSIKFNKYIFCFDKEGKLLRVIK